LSKHHKACPWAARASPARGIAKQTPPCPRIYTRYQLISKS
jgi:hypothetical protein